MVLTGLKERLAEMGFRQTVDLPPGFERCNRDEMVRLYPGISKAPGCLELRPVVAADNVTLRNIFQVSDHSLRATHSVCHIYLGSLEGWGALRVQNRTDGERACDQIADVLRNKALPLLRPFLSVQGAESLFEADVNHSAPQGLAILFSSEKLALLREARAAGLLDLGPDRPDCG